MQAGSGNEVLVVDADEQVQRGLSVLLTESGLSPTVVGDATRARTLAGERYFLVAIVDLDTPSAGAGITLVQWLRASAPASRVLVMAAHPSFDATVAAFRAGAADVIAKAPDQVQYLRERTLALVSEIQKSRADETLLGELLAFHGDLLRRLMETTRREHELERKLAGEPADDLANRPCSLLVAEEDDWLSEQLRPMLTRDGQYVLTTAASGGEAIDKASGRSFEIALVSERLPDLTGSMVIKTLKSQSPETLTVLFSRPAERPGKAVVIEGSKPIPLVPVFSDAAQLIERVAELRDAVRRQSRERAHLTQFRDDHYELIRHFADLKQRLERAIQRAKISLGAPSAHPGK